MRLVLARRRFATLHDQVSRAGATTVLTSDIVAVRDLPSRKVAKDHYSPAQLDPAYSRLISCSGSNAGTETTRAFILPLQSKAVFLGMMITSV